MMTINRHRKNWCFDAGEYREEKYMNIHNEYLFHGLCDEEYLLDSTYPQIRFGYGCDQIFGENIDVDTFAILLNEKSECEEKTDVVFYNNLSNPEKTVSMIGDCISGCCGCAGCDYNLDLRRMPTNVTKVLFAVVIYDAENRKQCISQLTNEFIYIRKIGDGFNCSTREPVFAGGAFKWNDIDDCSVANLCELVRVGSEWKLRMILQGYNGNIQELIASYGLVLK